MQKHTRRAKASSQADKDAHRSIASVFDKYGRDLSAFFSDVQRMRRIERSAESTNEHPNADSNHSR
jgi:hypothetical protein